MKVKDENLELSIAVGRSRREKKWKNIKLTWGELLDKLSKPVVTHETALAYSKMSRDEQDTIKDVGGFVAGELKEGKRKNGFVKSRSIITLDIDFGHPDIWSEIELTAYYTVAAYSTHKHTTKNPRLRLLIPLKRNVSADEYEAIARWIANEIGMDYFDDSTYEPARLMFWPSCSKDADYFFNVIENKILDPDIILNKYDDWTDTSYWPESSRASGNRRKKADKQGDPLTKDGLIGAFCRTYDIHAAISTFLSDVYAPTDKTDRYTYINGSTAGGLVIYEDKFAYSNHGTDPIGGHLCNAFDLVRIHKFGDLDDNSRPDLEVNKLPSWNAMMDLIAADEEVKASIVSSKLEEAKNEFDDFMDEEETAAEEESDEALVKSKKNKKEWMKRLSINKRGVIESTLSNLDIILNNDPNLKGMGGLDLFSGMFVVKRKLPWSSHTEYWSDYDDAGLRVYLEKVYNIEGKQKIQDALDRVFVENAYHPVKDYLNSLKWDGVKRLERLLIDYLGADDSDYVKAVTRKTLVAAVARIYEPGCKYDTMLTLVGDQGVGKSMLFKVLAGKWFSDTLTDIKGKEAYEALDGTWIIELAELSALKKNEREVVKSFLSKQVDKYRKAFARHVSINSRQCIFIGSTNDREFLNDATGGRRFWVVDTNLKRAPKRVWSDLEEVKDQIWAEAVMCYLDGENINWLDSEELAAEAYNMQLGHSESNQLQGIIEEFIDKKIPENFYKLDPLERVNWINATDDFSSDSEEELVYRTFISAVEVWVECMGKNKSDLTPRQSKNINECLDKIPICRRGKTSMRVPGYGTQRFHEIIRDEVK